MSIITALSNLLHPRSLSEKDYLALVEDGADKQNIIRKEAQMKELERILQAAEKLGVIEDTFILGGLAQNYLS